MPVTIYDIAREAGLSHATVSMALRDLPRVRQSTRERVQSLARKMGYSPNQAAVSLKIGHNSTVALILPHLECLPEFGLVHRIENGCRSRGYNVTLYGLPVIPEEQHRLFEFIHRSEYMAVVTYLYDYAPVADVIQKILAAKCPVVVIGPPRDIMSCPGLAQVDVDNFGAVRQCIEKLISIGHRRIVHTTVMDPDSPDLLKVNNFIQDIVEKNGIRDWEVSCPCVEKNLADPAASGYRAAEKILREKPGVTAIQCFNDFFAFGLMRGLTEIGVRVPEDISICGSDDTFLARYSKISLTSIGMKSSEAANAAWDFLERQLADGDWEHAPEPVRLTSNLVIRESTAPAPEVPFQWSDRSSRFEKGA